MWNTAVLFSAFTQLFEFTPFTLAARVSLFLLRGAIDEMKWLEVIHIRCAGREVNRSTEEILKSAMVGTSKGGLKDVRLYRNVFLPTDLCLYLHWERQDMENQGSTLGLCLTEALKEFCLVNHSLWAEEQSYER